MSKKDKSSKEIIEEGFHAERLLTDPVFCEAVEKLEDKWTVAWKRATDVETREKLWALVTALYAVRDELDGTKNRGEMEAVSSRRISTR